MKSALPFLLAAVVSCTPSPVKEKAPPPIEMVVPLPEKTVPSKSVAKPKSYDTVEKSTAEAKWHLDYIKGLLDKKIGKTK